MRSDDVRLAGRSVRESQIVAMPDRPNVGIAHDFFAHDRVPYIGMEYLPRGSLRP